MSTQERIAFAIIWHHNRIIFVTQLRIMRTQIIAVINQKGGVGKTTLSVQLAGAFVRDGIKTLLVDADPQGTAVQAVACSEGNSQIVVADMSKMGANLHNELKKWEGYELIVVDCPPNADSLAWQSILRIADLALIPTRSDAPDLLSTQQFVPLAIRMRDLHNPSLKLAIVGSCLRTGTKNSKEFPEVLRETFPNVVVTENVLMMRAAYSTSFNYGDSVHALPSSSARKVAIEETQALAAEALNLLAGEPTNGR